MRYVLPVVGTVAAVGLFAFSTANQAAQAVEWPNSSLNPASCAICAILASRIILSLMQDKVNADNSQG